MTDWKNDVIPKVIELLGEYSYSPTVRAIFYRLVSKGVISNVFREYKGLIQALGTARHKIEGEQGYISPFAFADDTRYIEDINDGFKSYEDYVKELIDDLKRAGKSYFEYGYLPAWHNQPNYVEVMIEKEALRGAFKSILPRDYVRIIPNKGWDSIPYRMENIARLYDKVKDGKQVYVLYFGDYDPTGIAMSYKIRGWLSQYQINFERIALNHDQISEYGLDHLRNPDPDVAEKLQRDSNKFQFMAENNGELFQIELDAVSPDQLRSLVTTSVNAYYDQSIHDKNLKRFTPKKIDAYTKRKVKFLD